ncbi:tetratricopeptide repeat protein, partial [Endozoicomonas sp. YOMI1]|uniref:tetratricopeptide repeat protein n=1 Tax=Endozoicomonas sp. YOMI1 TaxID=2828739 RepID=UPI002148FDB1
QFIHFLLNYCALGTLKSSFDEGFSSLSAGDNDHALEIAKEILETNSNLSRRNYLRASQLKARALLNSGRIDDCLQSIEQVKPPLDKGLLMTKGRALQAKNLMREALLIFQDLYKNHSGKDTDKKINYLALGLHYQRMGEHQEALTIFIKLRTDRSGHEAIPCNDKEVELALGVQYEYMGRYQEALTIFHKLRSDHSGHEGTPCKDKEIELVLGRLYQNMGRYQDALTTFNKLRSDRCGREAPPCNDKEIELALGRLYQAMGRYHEALTTFIKLRFDRSGHEGTPCNDKEIELTLGRQCQNMGLHQKALTTFIKLRTDRSGHAGTPCNDKGIELALGRLYQGMGRHQEALTTFIKLRTDRSGHEGALCNDKDIELSLGRQYQCMGRHQEALTVFKNLRTDLSGHESTPCNDKDIELALGRQYQNMGRYQEALAIFNKLHSDHSGYEGPPCNDKEIELALGDIHVDLMNWCQFDQMQLDDKGFAGPEVDLCISVRYFRECIFSGQGQEISGLLTKAIEHACNAIEKSQYLNTSSFSQLGHCLRIAALLPVGNAQDFFSKDELKNLASEYFTEANKLDPYRQDRLKNEDWRKTEHDFLEKLSPGYKHVFSKNLNLSNTIPD